jgi:tRNA (guanine-N7-)-methyltransferase
MGDGAEALAALPAARIERVHLLYPDPWPKRRQRKRRFVNEANLEAIARVLRDEGEFRFATDIDDYAAWTLARIARRPEFEWRANIADDWRRPWPDWTRTRYETKALAQGRPPVYLTFSRSARVP